MPPIYLYRRPPTCCALTTRMISSPVSVCTGGSRSIDGGTGNGPSPLLPQLYPPTIFSFLALSPLRALSGRLSPTRVSISAMANLESHIAGNWYSVPDLSLRDHRFTVPLDYSASSSTSIAVFAREVVAGNAFFLPGFIGSIYFFPDVQGCKE